MGVSDRFPFPKLPLRFFLRRNRITAAAAGGRTANAFEQLTNRGDHTPQHSAILTSAT
jgi:hypothetical protein